MDMINVYQYLVDSQGTPTGSVRHCFQHLTQEDRRAELQGSIYEFSDTFVNADTKELLNIERKSEDEECKLPYSYIKA